ncbi:MAG: glycosyltransferase [Rhodospirillaceae bacterium]|nr:glycosyltransferase [Rhodospirillaceae bacterium]
MTGDSQRLTLALPLIKPNLDVSFRGWMGGVLYLQNLARVLSLLDESERPRILVLSDGPPDTPVTRGLFREKAVAGIFRPDGYPVTLKQDLFAALVSNGQPNLPAIHRMFAEARVLFPILHMVFPAPDGLHWIPDFQHKLLPEMFDATEIAKRDRNFSGIIYERRFLLLSSESARTDMARFYPNPKARTFVWSFTSALDTSNFGAEDPRKVYGLPEKYLLAPNQFWKHKDHATLFRAGKLLAGRGVDITLVCTGEGVDNRHPRYFEDLRAFVKDQGLEARIKFLGVVPHDHLGLLFRFAAGIVQPSLFEGWSTVIEDAKALGRPTIASDLPVHLEQARAEKRFTFFKRGDAADLAEHIERLWRTTRPGPDPEAEAAARQRRNARDIECARQFLEIACAVDGAIRG